MHIQLNVSSGPSKRAVWISFLFLSVRDKCSVRKYIIEYLCRCYGAPKDIFNYSDVVKILWMYEKMLWKSPNSSTHMYQTLKWIFKILQLFFWLQPFKVNIASCHPNSNHCMWHLCVKLQLAWPQGIWDVRLSCCV